jgi:hypothetical protein
VAFVPPTELKLFARYGKQSRDEGRGDRTFITVLEKENESAAVKGAKIALEQRLRMEGMLRPYGVCKESEKDEDGSRGTEVHVGFGLHGDVHIRVGEQVSAAISERRTSARPARKLLNLGAAALSRPGSMEAEEA